MREHWKILLAIASVILALFVGFDVGSTITYNDLNSFPSTPAPDTTPLSTLDPSLCSVTKAPNTPVDEGWTVANCDVSSDGTVTDGTSGKTYQIEHIGYPIEETP